jgi:protein-disulfide isomerase
MSAVLDRPQLTVPLSGRDHVLGTSAAAVTLLEYGDYECPFCAAAHPAVTHMLKLVPDDVLFAYRHFPLTQIHPHAQQAAEAAEAAGAQGRFWEMHDVLFAHQDRLTVRDLVGYASALGLDLARFTSELQIGAHTARVREDFLSGVRSGVNGTPTFFVNGIRHNGGFDPESLLDAIGSALSAAG